MAAESGPETEALTAEYYDTDDFRLLKAGITLRRREGGADRGLASQAAGRAEPVRKYATPLDPGPATPRLPN